MASLRKISVELRLVIMPSVPKSCELDSLPTSLIQDYVDNLLHFLTILCNRSLKDCVLPDSQRDAYMCIVQPKAFFMYVEEL